MTRYILKRLISSVIVLMIIVTAALWITRMAPSNPCLKEREANTCGCVKENKLDRPVFPVYLSVPLDPFEGCEFWQPESQIEVGPVKLLTHFNLWYDDYHGEMTVFERLDEKGTAAFTERVHFESDWGETQYFNYVGHLVKFDLGDSMKTDRNVGETLASALPYTIHLGIQSLFIALLLGIPAGLYAGLKQNTPADYTTMTIAMVGVSIPNFVLGPILIMIFALDLGWFRPNGWDTWKDSVLPSITLGLFYAAYIARLTRGGMLEIIRKDFIRTARAKGLSEKLVVMRHALKGAILPVVSYLGPAFAALLTGSVVVEEIFNLPGVGKEFVRSALNRDYNMVLGTVILYSTLLVTLNLVVDVLYTVIDPRVKYD